MSDDTTTPPIDAATVMYGSTESVVKQYGPTIQHGVNLLRDSTGMTPEDAAAHTATLSEAFFDADMNQVEAGTIHSLIVGHLLEPADARTMHEWERETRQVLRERFGDEAEKRLAAARQFIEARPALKAKLNESGVGSHPRVVIALAERAHTLRMRPGR